MLLTNTHPAECLRFHPVAPFVKYIHKTNVIGPCDKHVLNNVLLNTCVAGAGVSGAGNSCFCTGRCAHCSWHHTRVTVTDKLTFLW